MKNKNKNDDIVVFCYNPACFSAILPMIGNLNVSPWNAFTINTTHMASPARDINDDNEAASHIVAYENMLYSNVVTNMLTITNAKDIPIDCIA